MSKKRRRSPAIPAEHQKFKKTGAISGTIPANNKRRKATRLQVPSSDVRTHAVLSAFFPTLFSLRKYLLQRLSSIPPTSESIRAIKKLQPGAIGDDKQLTELLNNALVGLSKDPPQGKFSDEVMDAVATASTASGGAGLSQIEVTKSTSLGLYLEETNKCYRLWKQP